ncbi:hypothetical protein [Methylovulum sp.]|uniref:hypothetical protein n=1 Tax=Methylovulum sp. TaxID=1916980 RepID=UPI002638A1BF|nr:hypothetical protein [Methylovulum sp.]MDD5123604.1 hypothetical protein [Methylovulum sp.]
MSINKKLLVLAIASVLPGVSAAVTLAPGYGQTGSGPTLFAEEITIPGTTLHNGVAPNDTILDIQTLLGFSIVGSSKYIRLDFPGTQLAADLTAAINFSTTDLPPAEAPVAPGTLTISAGGHTNDSYVIVELSGANLSFLDQFNFKLLATGIKPGAKSAHGILYRLYETASQAANPNLPTSVPLAASTAVWYDFKKSYDVSCLPPANPPAKKINVTNKLQFSDGTLTTPLFTLTAKESSNTVHIATGDIFTIGHLLPPNSKFTVNGHLLDIMGPGGSLSLLATPAALTATTGTWTLPSPPVPFNNNLVTFATDGTLNMIAGSYDVSVTQGPSPLLPLPNPYILKDCGNLSFSGSSDRVDFGLTPNATNKQWFRITNPSPDDGAVSLTVWNDAGTAVELLLSDIKVGPGAGVFLPLVLNHKSSTPLIDINAVYAAAQLKNAGFNVGTGSDGNAGKLRVEVRGAFGDDHVDGVHNVSTIYGKPSTVRLKDGIYIQAISSTSSFYQSH